VIDQDLSDTYDIRYASSYDRQEQLDLAAQADFLWAGWPKVDAEMIGQAPKLRLIHKCGVGVDKIDLNAAREKGVKVYLTAGINAIPVSEMALMLMMAVMRRIVYANISLRNKKWVQTELKGINQHLTGKTVGIVGMGNIGKNLVKLLKGFECRILYYDVQRQSSEVETALGIIYKAFEELLEESDVVTLHAPATPETTHMINARTLAMMDRGAILINTARGELVDEAALVDALRKSIIAGAGLDVFAQEPMDPNSPLLSMDNVILSPHVAGTTLNNMASRAIRIAKNLDAFIHGREVAKTDIVVG
jgi:D-3-phosphoglycerate dehydrogenase